MTSDELMAERLIAVNAAHLSYIDTATADRSDLHFADLDVMKVFVYELIQFLNHEWLRARLPA